MIRLLLLLFIPFRWFIEKSGADYNQFIQILKLKLIIDDRGTFSLSAKKDNSLFKQAVTLIFIGILLSFILNLIQSPFTFYYLGHTFIMVMMAMMIISEFSTVLLDTSDNAIIQPLPVKGNTLSLVRTAHVFIYLSFNAFCLSIVSIIIAFIKFGPGSGAAYIFSIILNVMLTLFIANILYLGIMHVATGEKLKNILLYFQIAIAILFMAGYQFGMRLIDGDTIRNLTISVNWYTYLIPPAFFSGFTSTLTSLDFNAMNLVFTIEAIAVPVAAIFLTSRYLTPEFNKKLLNLEQGDRSSKSLKGISGNNLWFKLMSKLLVLDTEERASFKLMWQMAGRERLFKQILFPAFGYALIFIVLPFLTKGTTVQTLATTDRYLVILYSFAIVGAPMSVALLSGMNKNAAWIFKSIPLRKPSALFKGTIKAAFARYFIPFYICIGIVICWVWGIRIAPDVLIVLTSIYIFTLSMFYTQNQLFPFTIENSKPSGDTYIKGLLAIGLLTGYGFFHYFLINLHPFANLFLIPFNIGLIFLLDRLLVYRIITWKSVDKVNIY
jgi:hypothetical protein